mgnify:CR=1 FL=1
MKLLTGFLMAWGNFIILPCPKKKWDDDLKNYMLGFLPTIVSFARLAGHAVFPPFFSAHFSSSCFMRFYAL